MGVGEEVRFYLEEPLATLAVWRNVAIHVYHAAMKVEHVRATRRMHAAAREKHPEGLGSAIVFTYASIDVAGSSDAARREVTALAREANAYVRATAAVVEGDGFVAAALRSAGTGIALLARPSYPVKYFPSIEKGAAFLAPHLKPAPPEQELADAVRFVRDRAGQRLAPR